MAFIRTINVEGMESILGNEVRFNFSYSNDTVPSIVSFSANMDENVYINGMCDTNGFVSYNVSGGIVSGEFLTTLETRCIAVLKNYQTV